MPLQFARRFDHPDRVGSIRNQSEFYVLPASENAAAPYAVMRVGHKTYKEDTFLPHDAGVEAIERLEPFFTSVVEEWERLNDIKALDQKIKSYGNYDVLPITYSAIADDYDVNPYGVMVTLPGEVRSFGQRWDKELCEFCLAEEQLSARTDFTIGKNRNNTTIITVPYQETIATIVLKNPELELRLPQLKSVAVETTGGKLPVINMQAILRFNHGITKQDRIVLKGSRSVGMRTGYSPEFFWHKES